MRRTTPASSSATPPGRRSRMCISMMSRSTARSLSRLIGGSAPKSATPPNFNRPKQIAMVVRQLASAIGRQKLRAEVFRQRHPVPPTCTHAASWSRRSAANALTHVPLIEPSFASDRKLAHMAGCCGSRDGEQPPTSAHQRQTTPHGGETSPSCRNCCAERLTARRTPCAALAVAADGLRFANPFMGYACCYQVRRGGSFRVNGYGTRSLCLTGASEELLFSRSKRHDVCDPEVRPSAEQNQQPIRYFFRRMIRSYFGAAIIGICCLGALIGWIFSR